MNNKGWDHDILIINKKLVFRFPKSESLAAKLFDEGKIVAILKSKGPLLKIPNYEFMYLAGKLKCAKYDFIDGKSLNEYSNINLDKNPENAILIGNFLTELHCMDVAELKETNLKTIHTIKYWQELYSSVRNNLFPFLNCQQRDLIEEIFTGFISRYPSHTFKKSIIHGDLTISNIIYNERKSRVEAIIDFTDAQIGDPAFDFAGLYWSYGPDFTKKVLSWYKTSESIDGLFERVKTFYGLQPVFHELLYSVRNNQTINWNTALDRVSMLKGIDL